MTGDDSLHNKLMFPTIPVGFVGDVLQAAIYRGIDVEGVLQANGLSQATLEVPGLRVSVDQYSRVLRHLGELTDDAFYGFLSEQVPIKALDAFCYGMVGCRNLEEFARHANDFYALFSDDFCWTLEYTDKDLLLGVHIQPVLPVDYRFIIQSLLLMTIRLFGWLLGEDPEFKSVSFTFAKNATDQNLAYLFGKRIDYECDANTIRMDASYADAGLSCTRDQVAVMLREKQHLFLLSRNKHPLSQEIRRILLSRKTERWLEVEEVAGLLNMNPNQLWRKLKKEGSSFLDIRDQIKRDWALVLLEDPENTVEMVADLLRYSDVSAFRKAFKKWTGMQPVQYRSKLP